MDNEKASVLIVDDEQMVCDLLDAALTGRQKNSMSTHQVGQGQGGSDNEVSRYQIPW